jgi:ribosomal protein S18 acetylase RimI-like enzyme
MTDNDTDNGEFRPAGISGKWQAVRIRPATREDAPSVARYIMMAEGEMVPFLTGESDEAQAVEKLVSWILSETPNRYSPENTLVAEEDGVAVAAAISFPADAQHSLDSLILEDVRRRGRNLERLFQEGVPGTFYLSTMGVEPESRRRGIGTALMLACEARARQSGFAKTSLLVDTDKERTQALYARHGFVAVETVALVHFSYTRMVHAL